MIQKLLLIFSLLFITTSGFIPLNYFIYSVKLHVIIALLVMKQPLDVICVMQVITKKTISVKHPAVTATTSSRTNALPHVQKQPEPMTTHKSALTARRKHPRPAKLAITSAAYLVMRRTTTYWGLIALINVQLVLLWMFKIKVSSVSALTHVRNVTCLQMVTILSVLNASIPTF